MQSWNISLPEHFLSKEKWPPSHGLYVVSNEAVTPINARLLLPCFVCAWLRCQLPVSNGMARGDGDGKFSSCLLL